MFPNILFPTLRTLVATRAGRLGGALLPVVLLFCSAHILGAASAGAYDLHVDHEGGDDYVSRCESWENACRTLEYAMIFAHAEESTIKLSAGTHEITGGPVDLADDVTISGRWINLGPFRVQFEGAETVITEGDGFYGDSLLLLQDGKSARLEDLTFQGASSFMALEIREGARGTVLDSEFSQNEGYFTGGIFVDDAGLTVQRSIFRDNESRNSDGGAIKVRAYNGESNVFVNTSVFIGNRAYESGGAIAAAGSSEVLVTNSVFCDNESPGGEGAIFGADGADLNVVNASLGSNTGGGIGRDGASTAMEVRNSIVWRNGPVSIEDQGSASNFELSNSLVQYLGDVSGTGSGNRARAPRWESISACDLRLTDRSSWAIDRGSNSALGAHFDSTDVEGDDRIQGGRVDIGADETSF